MNLLPIDAPPVVTGVQGGDRKVVGVSKVEGSSGKSSGDVSGDAKIMGKVLTTQIPITMPMNTNPVISRTTTTRPL